MRCDRRAPSLGVHDEQRSLVRLPEGVRAVRSRCSRRRSPQLRSWGSGSIRRGGAIDVSLEAGGSPPPELVEDTDSVLESMEEAVLKFNDPSPGSMVRVGLAPCSLTICSERLMIESGDLARRLGVTRHTHVAEVVEEEDYCAEVYGRRPVERLGELGWLGEDVWLAHVVHADTSDIDRLATTGTAVSHCPTSNMRLGSGAAPILEMCDAGRDRRPRGGRQRLQRLGKHARRGPPGDALVPGQCAGSRLMAPRQALYAWLPPVALRR